MSDLIGWIVVFELFLVVAGMLIGYWQSVSNTEAILRNQIAMSQRLDLIQNFLNNELLNKSGEIVSEIRPISNYFREMKRAAEYREAGL